MKILTVNKYYWMKGGSEAVFFSEKNMLEYHGHDVVPFSMQSDKNEECEFSHFFVNEVDYEKGGFLNRLNTASKIIFSFDAREKISMLLKKFSPNLAHFHIFQHQISPSVFGPLRKQGIPIILTLHDLKPICPSYKNYVNGKVCEACKRGKFYNCLKNKCTKGSTLGSLVNTVEMYSHYAMGYYQSVNRYIAVSRFYKQKMVESGFAEEKIDYLPNYVDVSRFQPSRYDKGYVLYFGRLSEEKGISTLIKAASYNSSIPHIIVGNGPLSYALKNETERNSIENISYLGYKEGAELKLLLSEATVVVVPSEWYENCPMTILEAFASGVPVIGSSIGGIPELINEEDGLIFQPGNAIELAEKIKWILENKVKAKEMGMEGRKKMGLKFNAEAHYDGLMSIYNSVLSNA